MNYIILLLNKLNFPQQYVQTTATITAILLFLLLSFIVWYFSKFISKLYINSKYFKLKSIKWVYAIREANIFSVIGYVATGFIANFISILFFPDEYENIRHIVNKLINIYFLVCIVLIVNKVLTIIQIIHDTGREIPIKGFIQFVKIFLNFFAFLIIFAYTIGKQPMYFISSLGIMASVLMIVFKDTIVGLTAGWQLSMNKMIRLGDWIEMPAYGVDGNVIDISLTTVFVKNWDNRIVTIPAYDLISKSFQSWREMQKVGARRIKRSFYVDMQSIKFADEQMIKKMQKFELLQDYIKSKEKDIAEYNKKHNTQDTIYNGRYLTNIGLFRIYCQQYIKTRPYINNNFSAFVRQLDPSPQGIPLEIYCFTNTADWLVYEAYQADVFDHLLSVIGEFDLNVFQNPTGKDLKNINIQSKTDK